MRKSYKSVLTIAGSDSGGCAGIQADIKSISACGGFAASVITATTAQNTQGVSDIHAIPITHIEKQLEAVLSDITFGAVKIGMLHSCEVIQAVKAKLLAYRMENIVFDPVMVATSGDKLITDESINCLKDFLPTATLITPNIPEAELLMGTSINEQNIQQMAKEIGDAFQVSVLLKGGHLEENELIDALYIQPEDKIVTVRHPRIETNNTHGTGCTLSSSIATFLSLGDSLEVAVKKGCEYIHTAIQNGKDFQLGKGHGPVNHFGVK